MIGGTVAKLAVAAGHDDPMAKAAVTAFLDSIGYGAVDTGPLGEGWRQQPGEPV